MGPFLFLCKFYLLFPHPWYFLVFIRFYCINWLDRQKTKPAFVLTPHMVRYVPLSQKLGHGKICILAIFILLRVWTLYKFLFLVHNFLFLITGNFFAENPCNSQIILFLLPNINDKLLLAFIISHLAAKPAYGIYSIANLDVYKFNLESLPSQQIVLFYHSLCNHIKEMKYYYYFDVIENFLPMRTSSLISEVGGSIWLQQLSWFMNTSSIKTAAASCTEQTWLWFWIVKILILFNLGGWTQ